MKKRFSKKSIVMIGASLLLVFCMGGAVFASAYEWPVSASVFNEESIKVSAVQGQIIRFSCRDIENRLGLDENALSGITITSLPHPEVGTLMVDGAPVVAYQSLTHEDIDRLEFAPVTTGIASTSFSFLPVCQGGVVTTVALNYMETPNASPIVKASEAATRQNIAVAGSLDIFEPDGDSYEIEITQKPIKGSLSIENDRFVYEPYLNKTGTDSFIFRAIDTNGNYSEEAVVSLVIEKGDEESVYLDMQGNPAHYAAVKLYENGVVSGEKLGTALMFYPDREVTQSEFAMMICSALGLDQSADACVNTGLSNDTELSLWLKPYIQALQQEEIFTERVFEADKVLTNAEAVRWITAAAKLPKAETTALVFKDAAEIPEDYLQDYISFTAEPAFSMLTDYAHPQNTLTRDTAALLVWQLYRYAHS